MKYLAAAIAAANARMWFGDCPAVQYQENFDSDKFAGNWYEIERDAVFPFEMGQECSTQAYRSTGANSLDLYFRAYFWMALDYKGIGGTLNQCGTSNDWTCQATMAPDGKALDKTSPINILATDYDNWSVMYICAEMMGGNMQWLVGYLLQRPDPLLISLCRAQG